MKKVIECEGKTIEEAISNGCEELGVPREYITYEIIEEPKKGFLGFGETLAKVRVTYEGDELRDPALEFVKLLMDDMDIGADVKAYDVPGDEVRRRIEINGGDSGILIGHHGATLDALQFIVNLALSKRGGLYSLNVPGADAEADGEESENADTAAETVEAAEAAEAAEDEEFEGIRDQIAPSAGVVRHGRRRWNATKVTIDIENYRAKREEILRQLARRTAARVQKYRKTISLEPMNPYERRIIHSEVQKLPGVTSASTGVGPDRRVQIMLDAQN